jgi:hypothetical protein
MTVRFIAQSIAVALIANGAAAQGIAGASLSASPIVLIDSTGKVAARALNETLMLVTVGADVVGQASIRPIYDANGHAASGLATWHSGGTVLFSSPDCTTGAHVHASSHAGLRASTQVETPAGILLYVGAVGMASAVTVRSILYDNGCAPVTVRQNDLVPVVATFNLTAGYPPPLAFQ